MTVRATLMSETLHAAINSRLLPVIDVIQNMKKCVITALGLELK
jgi:hypothetical protein